MIATRSSFGVNQVLSFNLESTIIKAKHKCLLITVRHHAAKDSAISTTVLLRFVLAAAQGQRSLIHKSIFIIGGACFYTCSFCLLPEALRPPAVQWPNASCSSLGEVDGMP